MQTFILENASQIRLGSFLGIFVVMAIYEIAATKKTRVAPKGRRWAINLGLTVINTILLRILIPAGAVGAALWASRAGWGLFNNIPIPPITAGVTSIMLLDMLIYWQHVAFHIMPMGWRLHMMHHTDLDLDVTSGARFHPLEILISMLIKMAAVIILGIPAWSVVLFEVILNGMAMFNHSNVRMPLWLDRILRTILVTPDMHRVHHSVIKKETNSNYGFNLSIWDKMFSSYIPQPKEGHEGMTIGLANFQDFSKLGLMGIIALPFNSEEDKL